MSLIASPPKTRLVVLLVKPTTYDDRGFPLRFWKGVLPSNSLAVMYSLTKNTLAEGSLPVSDWEVRVLDDAVWNQRVSNPEALVKKYTDEHTHVVVGLVGVQTNQLPRATELAQRFQKAGATVVVGGFHVSGSISTLHDGIAASDRRRADVPCPHIMPPEIQALMDQGVIVCHGESEGVWRDILADILDGEPKTLYRGGQPDLQGAPLPQYPPNYFDDFATKMLTFDTGRGCPFSCKFCTIINVQGRTMRYRDPQAIVAMIESICDELGGAEFFLTDDNFSRNPHWEEILDGLTALREQGRHISFMIEADLASYKIRNFIPKLASAGCHQVFLGMESVNQKTLKDAGKGQNVVKNYEKLCDELHKFGIAIHVGYIIGFPADTKESIVEDIGVLQTIGIDIASFFILTPLPGSEDHVRAYVEQVPMDNDFNAYDSFHAVCDHPNMTREELTGALLHCFAEFYRPRHMVATLKRLPDRQFWGMFLNLMWYRNAALAEGTHPMMAGFWSKRQRKEARPGYEESRLTFLRRETWRRLSYAGHVLRDFYVFQYVYFEAKLRGQISGQVSRQWDRGRGWWQNIFRKPSRNWLNRFWIRYGKQKWNLLWKLHWHVRMIPYAATEVAYTFYFGWILAKNLRSMTGGYAP